MRKPEPLKDIWDRKLKEKQPGLVFVKEIAPGWRGSGEYKCVDCGGVRVYRTRNLHMYSAACQQCGFSRDERGMRIARATKAVKDHVLEVINRPRGYGRMTITQMSKEFGVARSVVYTTMSKIPHHAKWRFFAEKPS